MGQLKDTLVSGNLRVTDDILANKINGVEVGSSPKFTDTNTWRGIQDNLTSSTNTTESLSAKQGYLLANGSARDSTKLPLAGGTMTGPIKYGGSSQEILRTGGDDTSWRGGLKYSWANNTTIALWGKNTKSQFVWHAGTDLSATDIDGSATRTYDFQVGRNSSGVLEARTGGNLILHSGNYTSYVNTTNFPGLNKTGTITQVGNTTSGTATVSSSNPTASWGGAVTVGSVGGVDLKFTMPGNPNTDSKVSQSESTTSTWRKVILSYQDGSAGAAVANNTNVVYGAVGIEAQPSSGTLKANILRAANNDVYVGSTSGSQCHQQYDATNKCLKFIFD